MRLLAVDERVLINPTHAAGIGSQRHAGVRRQLRPEGIDPIEHQLSRCVPPSVVVQDHIDERVPHVGRPPERLDFR